MIISILKKMSVKVKRIFSKIVKSCRSFDKKYWNYMKVTNGKRLKRIRWDVENQVVINSLSSCLFDFFFNNYNSWSQNSILVLLLFTGVVYSWEVSLKVIFCGCKISVFVKKTNKKTSSAFSFLLLFESPKEGWLQTDGARRYLGYQTFSSGLWRCCFLSEFWWWEC